MNSYLRSMKHLIALVCLIAPCAMLHAAAPNIVLIMADDLGYSSLGCYGNPAVKTPNIDALAESGIRLTDYHSNGVLCTPTRAALMTGRYQQRCVNVPDEELTPLFREQRKQNPDQRWAWGLSTDEVMMPAVLKQAGYRTALIGKWHLGYDAKFHPMNHGFDEFRGWVGGGVDNHTHIASHGTKELDWWNGRKLENEEGYSTDLLTKHATDFIVRNKTGPDRSSSISPTEPSTRRCKAAILKKNNHPLSFITKCSVRWMIPWAKSRRSCANTGSNPARSSSSAPTTVRLPQKG
jgi:hypothetical protein